MKLRCGDVLARDPDPLVRPHEMRGRIEPSPKAGRREHRIEHRRDRALPVGAAHERHRITAFGMIEECKERADAVESQLDAVGLQAVEPSDGIVCHVGAQQLPRVIIPRR